MKMQVLLNFEEIDKLPQKEKDKLEEEVRKLSSKALKEAQKDYCKKKGRRLNNKTLMDYPFYFKMMKAINKRKKIVFLTETLMMFNPIIRNFFPMKFYQNNPAQKVV